VSNLKNRFFPSPRHPDDVAEFVDSSIVIEDLPHHIGKIEKEPTIYLTFGSQEKFDEIRQKIEKRMGKEKVSIVMTSPQSLEIFSNKTSKGKALEQVMRM
uniref:HAD hydrolase family protein n=1 Tax=Streptococcus agalactiae TaxID=1311 RepID=UPI0004ABCF4B